MAAGVGTRRSEAGSVTSSIRSSVQSKIRHTLDYAQMPPIYKIPLWELNCGFGLVKKKHSSSILLKDCIKHQRKTQKADVTLVFAIRQSG